MAFLPIPGFERYLISPLGEIIDSLTQTTVQKIEDLKPLSKISLLYKNRKNRYRSVLVARLILITHKPIPGVNLHSVWGPKFIENSWEVSCRNLDYDFSDYSPPIVENDLDFHPVPGYIDTVINKFGVVKMSGVIVKTGVQRGYAVCSARSPNGKSVTVGRHRLLALTFLPHPFICDDLIVNHKNGTPADDRIDNLEWTTYHGNIHHAHSTNLVNNHLVFEVLNLTTGKVVEFFSIGDFCRKYQLDQREIKRLEFRLRKFGAASDYRGFSLRLKTLEIRWDKLYQVDKYRGNVKEVKAVSKTDGSEKIFLWFLEACKFFQISDYLLGNMLKKQDVVELGEYLVSYYKPPDLAGNS